MIEPLSRRMAERRMWIARELLRRLTAVNRDRVANGLKQVALWAVCATDEERDTVKWMIKKPR